MPQINVAGTIIDLPESASSPNWAPAILEAFQAFEQALNSFVGPYDVSQQVLDISSFNPVTNQNLTNFSFPTTEVRAVFLRYSVYRSTDTNTAYEAGNLMFVYNPNGPVNNKWEYSQDYIGDGGISFTMTDTGQIQFSTTTLAGTNHAGKLTAVAQAILQDNV